MYPKISIITCVYNGEKYISKLFDSVLNVGYPNIEHIIVNDGSTDSTENIVKQYEALYREKKDCSLSIKYIKQGNVGLGGATNTGLRNVSGDFWTWINCDDWYEQRAFDEPVEILTKRKKIDYVQMNGYYFSNNNKTLIVRDINEMPYDNKHKYYCYYHYYRFSKVKYLLYLCRTSSYKAINPTMQIYPSRYTQDVQFVYQMFGTLNGYITKRPSWCFLVRDNSYGSSNYDKYSNDCSLGDNSLSYLNIDQKVKDSLIGVRLEAEYLKTFKEVCKNHSKEESKLLFTTIVRNRKKILFRYKKYFDKKVIFYLLYCYL